MAKVAKNLQELERIRQELYTAFHNNNNALNSKEVYEVSKQLDKLIVKHMYHLKKTKVSLNND